MLKNTTIQKKSKWYHAFSSIEIQNGSGLFKESSEFVVSQVSVQLIKENLDDASNDYAFAVPNVHRLQFWLCNEFTDPTIDLQGLSSFKIPEMATTPRKDSILESLKLFNEHEELLFKS